MLKESECEMLSCKGSIVCKTPDQAVRVRALAGVSVLCSWARYFSLTRVPLPTQVHKSVPAD